MLLQCSVVWTGPAETAWKLMAKAQDPPAVRTVRLTVPFTSTVWQTAWMKRLPLQNPVSPFSYKGVPSYKTEKSSLDFIHLSPLCFPLGQIGKRVDNSRLHGQCSEFKTFLCQHLVICTDTEEAAGVWHSWLRYYESWAPILLHL